MVITITIILGGITYDIIYSIPDVITTRNAPCNLTEVNETSLRNQMGEISLYITVGTERKYLLDTARDSVTDEWIRLKPRDIINAKVGKSNIAFCGIEE